MNCKGLIFAAGEESRAHLPPKKVSGLSEALRETPRIRFALAVMVNAGVRQVMIGASAEDVAALHGLLGNGLQIGADLSYLALDSDSSIEQALSCAHRYIANSAVLLAASGVFCTGFTLPDSSRSPRSGITSFRMRNGMIGAAGTRPDLLLIGNGALLRLRRQAGDGAQGSADIDHLRRSCLTRFKMIDVDLTGQCAFANLSKRSAIDAELVRNSAVQGIGADESTRDA